MSRLIISPHDNPRFQLIQLEVSADEFTHWAAILRGHAEEHLVDHGDRYGKLLYLTVGSTEYRIAGPMRIRA